MVGGSAKCYEWAVTDANTPFHRLGGEAGLRALVDRFYDLMDALDLAQDVRAMHPASLDLSRDKLFRFLSGFLGGPPLYVQAYGHPRLRARHLRFPINREAARQWMVCMDQALTERVGDDLLRRQLSAHLARAADHMRNQDEPGDAE
jgi:hemoglobin